MAGLTLHRRELLLCAFFSAVLGWCPRVFAPTGPELAVPMRWILWFAALLWLFAALRPAGSFDTRSRAYRICWRLLKIAMGILLTGIMGWMHAYAYLVLALVTLPGAIAWASVQGLGLVLCAWFGVRRPLHRARAVSFAASLLFSGAFLFVILAAWMWSPPSPEVCASTLEPGKVVRMSPDAWPQEPSHPHSLLHLQDKGWLLGAFKMGGNAGFSFWDKPDANRVMGIDLSEPSEVRWVDLPALQFLLHMVYRPETEEILVSRMGAGEYALELLDASEFPRLTHTRTIPVDYAPHELFKHPTEAIYGVISEHGRFTLLNADTFEEVGDLHLGLSPDHVPVPLYAWHKPGTTKVYLSILLYPVVEVDLETRQRRWMRGMVGGGQMAGDPSLKSIYVTDMLFNRVDVVDLESLDITATLDLPYTPRAVHLDAKRDLLMVGEWFSGVVHLYRLSTLEPLNVSVDAGIYLRDLAFDTHSGMMYSASKCGVYQLNIDAEEQAPSSASPLVGVGITMLGTFVQSVQYTYEEKVMSGDVSAPTETESYKLQVISYKL